MVPCKSVTAIGTRYVISLPSVQLGAIIFGIDFALPLDQIIMAVCPQCQFTLYAATQIHRLFGFNFWDSGRNIMEISNKFHQQFCAQNFRWLRICPFSASQIDNRWEHEGTNIQQYTTSIANSKTISNCCVLWKCSHPLPIPRCMATAIAATRCSNFTWLDICCLLMPTDNTKHILSPYLRSGRMFVIRAAFVGTNRNGIAAKRNPFMRFFHFSCAGCVCVPEMCFSFVRLFAFFAFRQHCDGVHDGKSAFFFHLDWRG